MMVHNSHFGDKHFKWGDHIIYSILFKVRTFNKDFQLSSYVAADGWMIREWWIEMNLTGSVRGQF
jgi:hypothetical protein